MSVKFYDVIYDERAVIIGPSILVISLIIDIIASTNLLNSSYEWLLYTIMIVNFVILLIAGYLVIAGLIKLERKNKIKIQEMTNISEITNWMKKKRYHETVVLTLEKLDNEEARKALKDMLVRSKKQEKKASILSAFGKMKDETFIDFLENEYQKNKGKGNDFDYLFAIASIGKDKSKEAFKSLMELKKNDELDYKQELKFATLCQELYFEQFEVVSVILSDSLQSLVDRIEDESLKTEFSERLQKFTDDTEYLKEQYKTGQSNMQRFEMELSEIKDIIDTTQFDPRIEREIMKRDLKNLDKRLDDHMKTMRIVLGLVGAIIGIIATVSLIFVSLLASGVI